MGNKVNNAYINAKRDALKARDVATNMALDNYNDSKKHASTVQKISKRVAVDEATNNLAETTCKETVKLLEKIRDSAISEAREICNAICNQSEQKYNATAAKK
ncbi:MAG: hypothetical protein AMJ70_03910 [Dehalococcoidia bacterium SG8_51_3]|nr:MAG: hypothetical protein AMJ70_03910 [Dehalococcoidia bacterium SG8_51_3]